LYLPLLALAAVAPMSAHAETASFGGKTIKIIVGMPPGGGVDSYARLAQRHLGRFLPARRESWCRTCRGRARCDR
jgi:tripartite-type tricarboxylate transporter receptor subunit TctC